MSARIPFVAANWKMYKTKAEALAFVAELRAGLRGDRRAEVCVAPGYPALDAVGQALAGSGVFLAAQDVGTHDQGAYTGEVSGAQLRDVGCTHVIVGHSERRQLFGDTDAVVNAKVKAALRHGLVPILCIGELLAQREAGTTNQVVLGQLDAALEGLSDAEVSRLIVAYEPVWAIGTGKTATPADAQAVHAAIRGRLSEVRGADLAAGVRVIYGGSVKPENAGQLLAEPDIDGALVGGASLETKTFLPIVEAA